jgi:hypothetical protein
VELSGEVRATDGVLPDKANLFRNNENQRQDEPGVDKDAVELPPTQIGRASQELKITWIAAHSSQATGRVAGTE